MNQLRTEVIIDVLAAMVEARAVLLRSREHGHFEAASKLAVAEGKLRGGLQAALPKTINVSNP